VIANLPLHVAEDMDERADPSGNHRRSPAVS
jgi:hypothetical protein